jgi:hypothetical protein
VLRLDSNRVGDAGACALAQARWPRLRQLTLDWNGVGPIGSEALLESPGLASVEAIALALQHGPDRYRPDYGDALLQRLRADPRFCIDPPCRVL